jgi:hypothetical protein
MKPSDSTSAGDAPRSDTTGRLIEQLSEQLEPVDRVPRLRVAAAAMLALGAAYTTWLLTSNGVRPGLLESLGAEGPYLGVLLGLAVAAGGGLVAALASSIPGREPVVRAGVWIALVGWLGGIAICLYSLAANGTSFGPSAARDSSCFNSATGYGVLPAAGLLAYALRGWISQPIVTGALTLVGAIAVGAVIVHLGCPMDGAAHYFWGHLTAPILVAMVCTFPLGYGLRLLKR